MTSSEQDGLSLVELFCVMAIVAVLAAVAMPLWQHSIGQTRMRMAIHDFTATVSQARSEAIRRSAVVVVQRRDDCVHKDWSCGWFSFQDSNNNHQLDKDETVIRVSEPPPGVLVSTTASALKQSLKLTTRGSSQGVSAGSFFFQPSATDLCTRLVLSAGLRWRTESC